MNLIFTYINYYLQIGILVFVAASLLFNVHDYDSDFTDRFSFFIICVIFWAFVLPVALAFRTKEVYDNIKMHNK